MYEHFQKFMYTNNVVVAAAGFSIGVITKEFIVNILQNAVLPVVLFFLSQFTVLQKVRTEMFRRASRWTIAFNVLERTGIIAWLTFTWLATIILTYLVLEHLLNRTIIRMRTHMSPEDERMFREARQKVDAHPSS